MLAQLRYTNTQWRKIFTTSSSLFNGQFCISKNVFFFLCVCISYFIRNFVFLFCVSVCVHHHHAAIHFPIQPENILDTQRGEKEMKWSHLQTTAKKYEKKKKR